MITATDTLIWQGKAFGSIVAIFDCDNELQAWQLRSDGTPWRRLLEHERNIFAVALRDVIQGPK